MFLSYYNKELNIVIKHIFIWIYHLRLCVLINLIIIFIQVLFALMASIGIVLCEPPLSNQYGVPGNYAGGGHHGAQGGGNGFGGHYGGGHDSQDYTDNEVFAIHIYT